MDDAAPGQRHLALKRRTLSGERRRRLADIVLIGVSGSGKSSIGRLLAPSLGATFLEGDDYHPAANVAKMHAGVPLSDADRRPWLVKLGQAIARHGGGARGVVSACSALRRSYRQLLSRAARRPLIFVHLNVEEAVLVGRVAARKHRFMPASLLRSQLATLEPLRRDEVGFQVTQARTVLQTRDLIRRRLRLGRPAARRKPAGRPR